MKSYYKQYLKDGDADDKLKNEFEDNKRVLSRKAKVSQIDEKHWEIVDDRTRYRIEDTGTQLNIYKNGNLRHEMFNPTYHGILDLCRQNKNKNKNQGWNYHKLKVNGENFPWKMDLLLNWLVEKKIQTKWQRTRLKSAIDMRNTLSHLEYVPMFWPSTTELKRAAELINNLYHQNA